MKEKKRKGKTFSFLYYFLRTMIGKIKKLQENVPFENDKNISQTHNKTSSHAPKVEIL